MFPIIRVSDDASELPEQLGTKFKFWYRDNGRLTLFKQGRPNTGENWAEKVCAEIAAFLGLPHAAYDSAIWRDLQGVVTPNFVPEDARLVLGNELMARVVRGYNQTAKYGAREHTLSTVLVIMQASGWELPIGFEAPFPNAKPVDVFLGYLLLDALVGNQDRHHENWAAISWPGRNITLAPTYDHASSLGRNEIDERRLKRLRTKDGGYSVEAYCRRAKSAFYHRSSSQPLSTMEAFQEAGKTQTIAANYWLNRLKKLTPSYCEQIFANIPCAVISEPACEFALKMIEVNRRSILDL